MGDEELRPPVKKYKTYDLNDMPKSTRCRNRARMRRGPGERTARRLDQEAPVNQGNLFRQDEDFPHDHHHSETNLPCDHGEISEREPEHLTINLEEFEADCSSDGEQEEGSERGSYFGEEEGDGSVVNANGTASGYRSDSCGETDVAPDISVSSSDSCVSSSDSCVSSDTASSEGSEVEEDDGNVFDVNNTGSEEESDDSHEGEVHGNGPGHQDGELTFNKEFLQTRIRSTVGCSIGEGILMSATIANRHNLTHNALQDILKMCNLLLGSNALPASTHRLRTIFIDPFVSAVFYIYCIHCGRTVGSKLRNDPDLLAECRGCKTPCMLSLAGGNYFVILDASVRIKFLFESQKEISTSVKERPNRPAYDGVIRGVEDGVLHRTLFERPDMDRQKDFTFNLHVDGAKMFKTTKQSLYPIQMSINELPAGIRFKNIILVGLWYGRPPVMESFLEPFVKQTRDLMSRGVTWKMTDGEVITSKLAPISVCADSVQRPQLQNHLQFNGYMSCSWCYHPGEVLPGTKNVKYPFTNNMRDRRPSELIRDMREAVQLRGKDRLKGKNGVLGVSPLLLMPTFNHVWGYGVDYLHQVLLGVFDDIVQKMFERDSKCYIGGRKKQRSIDARLKSIRPPSIVPHRPMGFGERGIWKACDSKAIMLWYFIPCLHDVWKPRYLNHMACLIEGITLLLKKEITPSDLQKADRLLKEFGRDMAGLYGLEAETYNLHVITAHFAKSVQMSGNLWNTDTFPYEARNFIFKQHTTSSNGVPLQVTERVIREAYIPHLKHAVEPSAEVENFVEKVASSGKGKRSSPGQKYEELDGCLLTNSYYRSRNLTEEETDVLEVNEATEFKKLIRGGRKFTSSQYTKAKKTDDSYVRLANGQYGRIVGIFKVKDEEFGDICKCMVKIYRVRPMKCGSVRLSHIFQCEETDTFTGIRPSEIAESCIFIQVRTANGMRRFMIRFPNSFEAY